MTVNSNDLCYQHIDRCYRNFCQTSQDALRTRRQAPVDASAREEDSERRRIEALMISFPAGLLAGMALNTYRDMLEAKLFAGKTRVSSIRLALRAAVSLLLAADSSRSPLPDQARLDRYMQQPPGQMSALSGFVSLLNRNYGAGLSMERIRKYHQTQRRKNSRTSW